VAVTSSTAEAESRAPSFDVRVIVAIVFLSCVVALVLSEDSVFLSSVVMDSL
jgi:hypothetical protein